MKPIQLESSNKSFKASNDKIYLNDTLNKNMTPWGLKCALPLHILASATKPPCRGLRGSFEPK